MKSTAKKCIFLCLVALLVSQPSMVSAADFIIGISDLSVSPSTIFAGSTINTKVIYSVSSNIPARVRLELLFDGSVVDSSEQVQMTGNYEATFAYRPPTSSTGNRTIGVRARIYDGSILKDEDLVTKSVQISPTGTNHRLEITAIANKKLVSPNEEFPVDVEVKNTGNSLEENVVLSAAVAGKVYYGSPFAISPGEKKTVTIAIPAPSETGTREITITAYNSFTSAVETTYVDVQGTSISLTLAKTTAQTGEWVDIYGYATRGNVASESAVSLYIDNVFSGLIPARENGYYRTSLKFDAVGSHRIGVLAGGLTTSQIIYITPEAPSPAPVPPAAPKQIIIPPGNYAAIIVVTTESQFTVYPEARGNNVSTANVSAQKEDKYANASFVNIDVSANELDAVQNSGNVLKITITNHLGRSELFSVNSDFRREWAYLPGAEVIPDKEKKVFEIYFAPDTPGTFVGNVLVFQKDRIIKIIPVSLFVAPRETEIKEALPFGFALGIERIAALAIILSIAVLVLYFGARRPKALEPKAFGPPKDISEILKAMKGSEIRKTEERYSGVSEQTFEGSVPKSGSPQNGVFFVPRDKIII